VIELNYSAGLKGWVSATKDDSITSQPLRLGAFIDPEIVLNSLRQKTCRMLKTPLDKLRLVTEFAGKSGKCSCYITVY